MVNAMLQSHTMTRSRSVLTALYLACAGATLGAQTAVAIPEPPGLRNIQAEELKKWATYLASDELAGRLTGSRGQRLAAEYIAKHFESLGLEPLGDAGEDGKRGFIQKYPVTRTSLDPQATSISLEELGGENQSSSSGRRFAKGFAVIPAARRPVGLVEVKGEFVYAGLANIRTFKRGVELEDWAGKIPVFVIKLPKARASFGIERQMMTGMLLLSSLKRRTDKLAKRGAKVAVYCVFDDNSSVTNMLTYISIAPGQDLLVKKGSGGMGAMMSMMAARVPTVYLTRKVSLAIVEAMGLTEATATTARTAADVAKLKGARGVVKLTVKKDPKAFATNVVAVLRGSDDKLAKEALIYSAHMDHVGMRMDGDAYNGADDNASGSAGLMAIAKAFAATAKAPRRSVIFLSVSGEELGLWGSAHYADNPTWDIDDIVANINTDMIGRNGPESGPMSVTVTPSYRHRMFSTIVRDSAKIGDQMGLEFTSGDKYYQRSDHYNFARKGIPVVFFCNGEHKDYHQVSDHAEKLDADKMQRIARLAYWTGYRVASANERPSKVGRSKNWLDDKDR
jgi:Peptidase family M28